MNYPFRLGQKIYLRALEVEDIEHCLRWFNDPLITKHLESDRVPLDRKSQIERMEQTRKDPKQVVMAICKDDNDLHIGNVGLHNISLIDRTAKIDVVIGERTLHHKGFGSEAIRAMCSYGFKTLNLNRLYLRVKSSNHHAIGCYKKCGFVEEGTLREHSFEDGEYVNLVLMGLLREEWETQ